MEKILVENVYSGYQDKVVIKNIDFEIPKNSITCIIGQNGAGKSTLFKCMLGLHPYTGNISWFGKPLNEMRQKIAYIPQLKNVSWDFPITVYESILMGRYSKLGMFKKVREIDKKLVDDAIKMMDLEEHKHNQISQLSGGQKQRVFIARAIVQEPEIFMFDEPFSGIDKKSESIIVEFLQSSKKAGKTSILVHHDLNTVKQYFDFGVIINETIVGYGPIHEVYTKNNLRKADVYVE